MIAITKNTPHQKKKSENQCIGLKLLIQVSNHNRSINTPEKVVPERRAKYPFCITLAKANARGELMARKIHQINLQ